MKVAGLLLAAGRSTRFGTTDKLAAPLAGRPLIGHAADTMASVALALRFLVGGPGDLPGFTTIPVDGAPAMSRSIRIGVATAQSCGADAVLVMLADMPFVQADHVARLLEAGRQPDALVASTDGTRPSPPALFGAAWFPRLQAATGDHGARGLLAQARLVHADPSTLIDIDTPADLVSAQQRAIAQGCS